jgi:hypothetical protein
MKKVVSFLTSLGIALAGVVSIAPIAQAAPVTIDTGNSASHSDSNTSRKIAVAPNGDIFVLYKRGGGIYVAKSTDDGATFAAGVQVVLSASAAEIAVSISGVLYVTWSSSGTIFQKKSVDSGATWSSEVTVATGLTGGNGSAVHTAVDREYVYAIYPSGEKVFSSADSGATWREAPLSANSWAFSDILVDPLTGRTYAFVDDPSVSWFASVDRGLTFSAERQTGKQVYYSVAAISSSEDTKYLFMAGSLVNLERLNLNTNAVDTLAVEAADSSSSRTLAADGFGNVVSGAIVGTAFKYQVSNDFGTTMSTSTAIASSLTSNPSGAVAINQTNGDILFTWSSGGTIFFDKVSNALVGYDLNLDITSVDFDTAGNKIVTITNKSATTATLTIELSNSVFTQTNTCTTLAQNASCAVTITAATAGAALLKVTAGSVERLIPVAFGASSATVEAEVFTDAPVAAAPYTGPIVNSRTMPVATGQRITLNGSNLSELSSATISGKDVNLKVLSPTSVEITIPEGLAAGEYDLVISSSYGLLTVQSAITVGRGSAAAARASTKLMPNGVVKVWFFEPVKAGKVQIFFNGKEIAWVNATSSLDAKLSNGYLVRTLNLKEGKNVVEVYVDGERVRRVAHTK